MKQLARRALLQATTQVVQQDAATLESLYPPPQPKIRLLDEDIMAYAETLYYDW